MPRDTWLEMLATMGYSEAQFAQRYDLVIHLVSTAHGAEEIYIEQMANNPARTEAPQEARELDDKVLSCWASHPRVLRLDNSTATFHQPRAARAKSRNSRLCLCL